MENPSPPPGIVRTCPSCSREVGPGHTFCEICGTKIPELPVCRNCGARFIAPVKFCEMCGTPVAPLEPAPAVAGEPGVSAPEPVEQEPDEPEPEPIVLEPYDSESEPLVPEPVRHEPEPEPVRPSAVTPPRPARAPGTLPVDPLSPAFSGLKDEPKKPGPVRPPANKALIAGGIVVLLVIVAALWFVGLPMLMGGVTGVSAPAPAATLPATMPPTPVPTPSPVPQTAKETVLPTPDNSHVPQPTQIMPDNQRVYFDVQKDGVTDDITVLFQRGPGENIIRYAEVKVTHPDGTVETGTITPSLGQTELILDGSRQTDRVEVIAYMHTGLNYRVKDELMT